MLCCAALQGSALGKGHVLFCFGAKGLLLDLYVTLYVDSCSLCLMFALPFAMLCCRAMR
jgi:hypothetical protein